MNYQQWHIIVRFILELISSLSDELATVSRGPRK